MTGIGLAGTLGIRSGAKVSIIHAPTGFVERLAPLPDGVEFLSSAKTGLDVTLFFTKDAYDLVARLPDLARAMAVTGRIWICFHDNAKPPMCEAFVRQAALEFGLADDRKCPLGDDWTGLRVVWKQRVRPEKPEAPSKKEVPPPALA